MGINSALTLQIPKEENDCIVFFGTPHWERNMVECFVLKLVKEEWGRWYASPGTERKEHMESISSVEGGQPSFYAENIPFSFSTIFSSSPTPKLVSCRASPRLKTLSYAGAFRQDLYNHAKTPHLSQSHNVVIYMCADVKHGSRSEGGKFNLPNRPFLSP